MMMADDIFTHQQKQEKEEEEEEKEEEEDVEVNEDAHIFSGSMPLKNTFVHFPNEKPHLFLERETKSCPSSWVDGTGDKCGTGEEKVAEVFTSYASMDSDMMFPLVQAPVVDASLPLGQRFAALLLAHQHVVTEIQQPIQESLRAVAVLSLASALPEETPEPHQEIPTVGSAGHWSGTCRPCAFMVRGCTSGESCPFCHLCEPTEKKRRRKEKITFMRELRRWKKGGSGPADDLHQ